MTIADFIFPSAIIALISFGAGYLISYRQTGKKIMKDELDRQFRKPMRKALGKFSPTFSNDIQTLSPTFCEIFDQALEAEQEGLEQICGIGYGKSLEFLIKDYAIQLHPDKKEVIEKSALANCIKQYMNDDTIKNSAELATWLRNDEAHYVRKWADKDVKDLKNLITLTVTIIQNNIIKGQLDKQVQDIRGKFN